MKGCPYCPAATRRAARKRFPGLKCSSFCICTLSLSLSLSFSFSARHAVLADPEFPAWRNRREELFQQIIARSDRADRYRRASTEQPQARRNRSPLKAAELNPRVDAANWPRNTGRFSSASLTCTCTCEKGGRGLRAAGGRKEETRENPHRRRDTGSAARDTCRVHSAGQI